VTLTRAPRILVVGSTMMDLVTYVDRAPEAGETIAGGPFELGFGGKGANQAVMATLLGADVAFVNRVGDDLFGARTRAHLGDVGIDVTHVHLMPDEATGAATILIEPSGENRIVLAPGANAKVSPTDVEAAFAALPTPDVVLCQLEIDQRAVTRAFELGRAAGAVTILNPAPAAELAPELVGLIDWLVPNEIELRMLAASVGSLREPHDEAMATALSSAWGLDLVTTLGPAGARITRAEPEPNHVAIPAPRVTVADTVGAGDAFVGSFAVALAAGATAEDAVGFACRCAADSVTRRGTQRSFLASAILPELHDALRAISRT
jgi:ribokinase